jgi:hypothetical protein
MTFIAHITVSQAATVINACIAVVHQTSSLALAVLLIYVMRNANTAITWSTVTRRLHSSPWPTLLRADSARSHGIDPRVRSVDTLAFLTAILLAAAGIITPLGLRNGPISQSSQRSLSASYVPDLSPLGEATPQRNLYTYGRICGAFGPVPCPGNGNDANTSVIAPSVIETFNSTPYGPFNLQFRRYYPGQAGYNYSMTLASISMTESFILRNDIFAVGGAIVDLTSTPGIGFWNHTLPSTNLGGVWTEDVLFLEPVTSCVNTNLTYDYILGQLPESPIDTWNITDRGGIVNLTTQYPEYSRDGQDIDLHAHAYKGAVLMTFFIMQQLGNLTRNESYVGKGYPQNITNFGLALPGSVQFTDLGELLPNGSFGVSTDVTIEILCEGYGGGDTANITNVAVHCGLTFGPPQRTDGGDRLLPSVNSTWSQGIYACASATRARMQSVTFSFNGTSALSNITISRQNTTLSSGLWAMENSTLNITDVDLFWGRVADSYENDPSLSTTTNDVFWIPAGASDTWGVTSAGQPATVVGASWSSVIGASFDYSGGSNYALLNKWQSALEADPVNGAANINNWIWTDIVANNLMGSDTSTTLFFAKYEPSITYEYVYGIPAFLLVLAWLLTFLTAIFALIAGVVKLKYLRFLLNHTSVGRVILGDSQLKVVYPGSALMSHQLTLPTSPITPNTPAVIKSQKARHARDIPTTEWAKSDAGRTCLSIGGVADGSLQQGEEGLLLPGAGDDREKSGGNGTLLQQSLTNALAGTVG